MRWERLFADLEAQLEAVEAAELAAEVDDRTRRDVATVTLAARLGAAVGHALRIEVSGVGPIEATIRRCGPDWLLVESGGRESVVALSAVVAVHSLTVGARPADGAVASRLRLGYVLRGVARDRDHVTLTLRGGQVFSGTVARVGADVLDLAVSSVGEPPGSATRHLVTLPLEQLALLRRG